MNESRQPPTADQPNDDPGPVLVVLLHAYSLGPESLYGLRDRIRSLKGFETDAEAEIIVPALPLSLLSLVDPSAIVNRLIEDIDRIIARSGKHFDRILLIGHSFGALLARKLYVVACGETDEAPFEQAISHRRGKDWAAKIDRVVLLAGMNRGWRVSHHLSLANALLWTLGIGVCNLVWLLTQRKPSIFYIRKGASFITQLRIQWIKMRQQAADRGVGSAVTVQLLGSVDDMVSPEDNIDLISGRDFVYRDIPFSNHANVIDVNDPTPLPQPTPGGAATRGEARFEVIRDVLESANSVLLSGSVIPSDQPPPEENYAVRDVVFVIHGIRDEGYWTHKIARRVQALARAEQAGAVVATETSSYGYFPMLSFLLPGKRREKVEWLMDRYTEAMARYPKARFSYVGHSNGTYLLARALKEYPSCRFRNVVFAGSVVRTRYPWNEALRKGQVERVLNYVATADWVVAIFPKAIEILHLQDLGSAGHDGFSDGAGSVLQQIRYVRGFHGAALAEENWDAIARFALHGKMIEPPASFEAERRSPLIALLGRVAPLLWVALGWTIYVLYRWILNLEVGEAERTLLAGGLTALIWVVVTRV